MVQFGDTIAIIPARGGSKRLPGKNTLPLGGKPLIAHTIQAAIDSELFTSIVVSTDSEEIRNTALEFKAEAPFLRPEHLASDSSRTADVLYHTLEYYRDVLKKNFSNLALLQPTSPLRNANHLQEAVKLFQKNNATAVISVCPMEHTPLWSNTLPENLSMDHFFTDDMRNKISQDLPQYYRINGAIYICNVNYFLEYKTLFPDKNGYAYVMSPENSVDIDNESDFQYAEFLLQKKKK